MDNIIDKLSGALIGVVTIFTVVLYGVAIIIMKPTMYLDFYMSLIDKYGDKDEDN